MHVVGSDTVRILPAEAPSEPEGAVTAGPSTAGCFFADAPQLGLTRNASIGIRRACARVTAHGSAALLVIASLTTAIAAFATSVAFAESIASAGLRS